MINNICRFIPYHKDYHSIHTINFVMETGEQKEKILKSETVYKMYCVKSGTGFIHTPGQIRNLSAGDIFFTFPAKPFCIESEEDFSYMYISFLGSRGNMIMEKLGISSVNFLFSGCSEVCDFWEKEIEFDSIFTDLVSESVLLYTFSHLGQKLNIGSERKKHGDDTISLIKKYIDDNFSDTEFSLDKISEQLNYNKKYISTVFKKRMNVGIIEYLNTIRVQHACTMIQQGFTGVTDIACCCGYRDPQYFSKIFRLKMGMSPVEFIKSEGKNKNLL